MAQITALQPAPQPPTKHRAFVQISSEADRLVAGAFSQALARCPTVSIATNLLMRAGLIRYIRGQITVTDRAGLEAASRDCYRVITRQFERLGSGNA